MTTPFSTAFKLSQMAHFENNKGFGESYFFEHVLRVVEVLINEQQHNVNTYTVGLLHDILEDTNVTVAQLLEDTNVTVAQLRELQIPTPIIEAVVLLTRTEADGTYLDYIRKIAESGNKMAIAVKLADNKVNSSNVKEVAPSMEKRYKDAREILEGVT
jgi:(p)ppGpp synthase/HD superfamily hydrolase